MNFNLLINNALSKIELQKQWMLVATFIFVAIALSFAFPSYDAAVMSSGWEDFFIKAAHPLKASNSSGGSHEAKLAFRLTLPFIVHFVPLDIAGTLILLGVIGIINIYLVILCSYKISGNKPIALFIGLITCLIYAGKCSFIETRGGIFDGLALFFLLIAFATRLHLVRMLAIFLAAFTDERGLIASSLLLLFTVIDDNNTAGIRRFFTARTMSIIATWVFYFATRFWLARTYGLPTSTEGTGPGVLLSQINNIPIGTWSALEGGWILVLYSLILLYNNKKYLELLMYIGCVAIIILVGLSVVDITRSVMYVFPAVFVSLAIFRNYDQDGVRLERLLWFAFLLSLAYPPYYTGGKSSIWWNYPLPIQIYRFLFMV